jgi:hypothetical protein
MANTIITPTWVGNDIAENFNNKMVLVNNFTREWDDAWRNKPGGAKVGYVTQCRIPQRFVVNEGQALVQQAILNQTVPLTINHQQHVGCGWSSADDALAIPEARAWYTEPAGLALANKVDTTCGNEVYKSVPNFAGSPGTAITANATYLNAVAKLENLAVPTEFKAVLDPLSRAAILNANLASFNPSGQISQYFRTGEFNQGALGIESWYSGTNAPIHTTGTFTTATPIVSSANQTGSTLAMSGLGTYAFKQGDTFTVAGVDAANPLSYADTGQLQGFTITADISGTTTRTLPIYPPIITSGPLQTVTVSPANNAVVTFTGATGTVGATMAAQVSRQSLIFHPGAFAFVMADLPSKLPGALSYSARSKKAKLSMRWAEQYNIQTDQMPSRVDVIYGAAAILPYFAHRLYS